MNPILRETLAITSYTFASSVGLSGLLALLLRWPFTPVYFMAVLTIGPSLAILRGRNREKDALEIGERAGVELLALVILMAIGWGFSRIPGH